MYELVDDILEQIINKLHIDTIIKKCTIISQRMNLYCNYYLKNILINKSKSRYQFDVNIITIQELYRMCRLIDNPYFTPIIAGSNKSLILGFNGLCYKFIIYRNKQLKTPAITECKLIDNIKMVSFEVNHTLALSKDGLVYSVGINERGQLGLNDTIDRLYFEQIPKLTDIISISAGAYNSLVLKRDKTVYAFGSNYNGKSGLDNIYEIHTPNKIKELNNIIQIYAGIHYF